MILHISDRILGGMSMKKYICNPVNLNYRYQFYVNPDTQTCETVAREAADPSVILFRGKYYMFASMTLGVWVSQDLSEWEYHRLPDTLPLYDYAPDVRVCGEYVYFSASKRGEICNFYRTKDILHGPYEELPGSFDFWDPSLFVDEDGRMYFYWGCNNITPIYGVELDPAAMRPLSEPCGLIWGDPYTKGYERVGEDGTILPRDLENRPFIEGAWMDKYEGKYYLQYAFGGTEYNTYGDGVYVSDQPLGPFRLAKNNPYSYKPGGFLPGAGHGSTFRCQSGAWWHAATMRISMNHSFERRVGIWPAGFDADGELFCNQRYGDWPMELTGLKKDPWKEPEWYLLSCGKSASASSSQEGHGPRPQKPVFEGKRTGDTDLEVKICDFQAVGWNILWGTAADKLYHSYMVFEPFKRITGLVKGEAYWVRVDAFNEAGITQGDTVRL